MKLIFSFICLLSLSLSVSAGNRISSPWAKDVDPAEVLPEYPRPQMYRPEKDVWMSLNGIWDYQVKDAGQNVVSEGDILVPFCIESALSGVCRQLLPDQTLVYRRTVTLPRSWKRGRVLLNFGAVDWETEVYVNGMLVGSHVGGYVPFSFDITDALKRSTRDQMLEVRVKDATDGSVQPTGKQSLNPREVFYSAVSGIWQTVWMEHVPESYISRATCDYSMSAENVAVKIGVMGGMDNDSIRVRMYPTSVLASPEDLFEPFEGEPLRETTVQAGKVACLSAAGQGRWDGDSPQLCRMEISLLRNGKIIDNIYTYTALREVSVGIDSMDRKRIAVNGNIVLMNGLLDQGYWPEGLYTAPTEEALISDIHATRELGFNMIRKHMKTEPYRWYTWCDILGMYVWQDMPSLSDARNGKWAMYHYNDGVECTVSEDGQKHFVEEWMAMIEALKPFQCITMWIPFNECWGQFSTGKVADMTCAADPSRLVNMASGGSWYAYPDGKGGYHKPGHVIDNHHYPDPWIDFWDFDMINVLGEWGGLSLPLEGHLWNPADTWGYKTFSSGEEIAKAYEDYGSMLMRLLKYGCAAFVYTQTTDVENETNGLLTYDRIQKTDCQVIRSVNEKLATQHFENIAR